MFMVIWIFDYIYQTHRIHKVNTRSIILCNIYLYILVYQLLWWWIQRTIFYNGVYKYGIDAKNKNRNKFIHLDIKKKNLFCMYIEQQKMLYNALNQIKSK